MALYGTKKLWCRGKQDFCESEGCDCKGCPAFEGTGCRWGDPENPYWERICDLADRQRTKGIATYGQGLESNPADMLKRIEHLQEELIDGLMYCEWIKDELKKMEGSKNDSI